MFEVISLRAVWVSF